MYRILFVDDEQEVRQGIISRINWEKYGFQIMGQAENGKDALEIIERDVPDIVITDIKMPLMDGMELTLTLYENYPTVKIIILTGFDEFKYAQQSIKYGVSEYILKPVLPKDMEDLLSKLKVNMDEEVAKKEDIKMLKAHYVESLPILKDNFFNQLITRKIETKKIENKIKKYSLNLKGSSFVCAVISLDVATLKGSNFNEEDIDIAKFAILNISNEIILKHGAGEVFFNSDLIAVILCLDEYYEKVSARKSFLILEEIRQNIEKYMKFQVTIGMGEVLENLSQIPRSFLSANKALDYRLLVGNNRVIYIQDVEPQKKDTIVFDEQKERLLNTSLKFGTEKEVVGAINELFNEFSNVKASFKEYQMYLIELIAAILKVSKSMELDLSDVLGEKLNLFEEAYKFNSLTQAKEWITSICLLLTKSIVSKRQNTCKLLLQKAMLYINENYGDPNMSINMVSNHLHISPSYMSLIFKKETGATFSDYIVGVRLEAAKEFLKNTNLKTAEIAEKIGYSDPHYFSYFFKKNFGMSPREYRK